MNNTVINDSIKEEFINKVKNVYWTSETPRDDAEGFYNIIIWLAGVVGVDKNSWETIE